MLLPVTPEEILKHSINLTLLSVSFQIYRQTKRSHNMCVVLLQLMEISASSKVQNNVNLDLDLHPVCMQYIGVHYLWVKYELKSGHKHNISYLADKLWNVSITWTYNLSFNTEKQKQKTMKLIKWMDIIKGCILLEMACSDVV